MRRYDDRGWSCGPGLCGSSHRSRRHSHYQRRAEEIWNRVQTAGRSIRRSPEGRILGVCRGLADYFGLPVKGVRLMFILAAIFTGFWPVIGVYLLAGLIFKPGRSIPRNPGREWQEEPEFKEETYMRTRKRTVSDLKETFSDLDERLKNLEDTVTAKEFDWERRYRES